LINSKKKAELSVYVLEQTKNSISTERYVNFAITRTYSDLNSRLPLL
jgi:hypothetical protein